MPGALNQLSLVVVIVVSLAVIFVSGGHVAHHFGVIRADPVAALVAARQYLSAPGGPSLPASDPPAPTASPTGAGPTPFGAPPTLPSSAPQPSDLPEDLPSPTVPAQYELSRPMHAGTWLPILMYHYIRDVPRRDTASFNLAVSPEHFRAQVQWIRDHGYTAITMHEVDLILAGKQVMPDKPVALTFDDGYRDFYTTAAPILEEYGITATNYVPTQLVGGKNYLSWNEIQVLDAEGFEMAAHTQFHVDLTTALASRARLEIFGSKADLESHLGHPVYDFAYPYGAVTAAAARLVREAGFWSAVTTRRGAWHDAQHLLYLTRIRMGPETSVDGLERTLSRPGPNPSATPSASPSASPTVSPSRGPDQVRPSPSPSR